MWEVPEGSLECGRVLPGNGVALGHEWNTPPAHAESGFSLFSLTSKPQRAFFDVFAPSQPVVVLPRAAPIGGGEATRARTYMGLRMGWDRSLCSLLGTCPPQVCMHVWMFLLITAPCQVHGQAAACRVGYHLRVCGWLCGTSPLHAATGSRISLRLFGHQSYRESLHPSQNLDWRPQWPDDPWFLCSCASEP